jgi:hypothetical protein
MDIVEPVLTAEEIQAKTDARNKRLLENNIFIVLGINPVTNKYCGPIKNSFGLDIREGWTQAWWSAFEGCDKWAENVDGQKEAQRSVDYWVKQGKNWNWKIYRVQTDELPIVIDWEHYLWAHTYDDKTLSGIVDKYGARNFRFKTKEECKIEPPEKIITLSRDY